MKDEIIKRKKGAPRKVFIEEDSPRDLHTRVKTSTFNLIPVGRPINEVLEELITVAFANKEVRDLAILKKRAEELDYELSKVKVEIKKAEDAIRTQKEVQNEIIKQRKYLAYVVKKIIKLSWKPKKVTMKPEWIQKLYGLTFDIAALEKILADKSTILDQLLGLSELEIIETIAIRKIGKGEKEQEILQEMLLAEGGKN